LEVTLEEEVKAILEFSLPEEAAEHKTAVAGAAWKGLVWELDQWLRGIAKHGDTGLVKAVEVREKIRELLADEGLDLDA
jgi:hypothetical protein